MKMNEILENTILALLENQSKTCSFLSEKKCKQSIDPSFFKWALAPCPITRTSAQSHISLRTFTKILEVSTQFVMQLREEDREKWMKEIERQFEKNITAKGSSFQGKRPFIQEKEWSIKRMENLFQKSKQNVEYIVLTEEMMGFIQQQRKKNFRTILELCFTCNPHKFDMESKIQSMLIDNLLELKEKFGILYIGDSEYRRIFRYFSRIVENGEVTEEEKMKYQKLGVPFFYQEYPLAIKDENIKGGVFFFSNRKEIKKLVPKQEWEDIKEKIEETFQRMVEHMNLEKKNGESKENVYVLLAKLQSFK